MRNAVFSTKHDKNEELNHIIIRENCVTLNTQACYLVDTGSGVSLVSNNFLHSTENLDIAINSCSRQLKSFNGDQIRVHGQVTLTVCIAGMTILHTFIITDMQDSDFLIGNDILCEYGINIDMQGRTLQSKFGSSKFISKVKQLDKCLKIRCDKTVIVPPNSAMLLTGKAETPGRNSKKLNGEFCGFIEPYNNLASDTGLFVAASLNIIENGKLPIRCLNLSDEPVYLHKRKLLGFLNHTLANCDNISKVSNDSSPSMTSKVNSELKNKTNVATIRSSFTAPDVCPLDNMPTKSMSSNTECNTEFHNPTINNGHKWTKEELWKELKIEEIDIDFQKEDVEELKSLVWEYRDCFSAGPYDLGKCKIYEGEIKLKPDSSARWIPARPVPYKKRAEMKSTIENLHKADVIEPCKYKSLWNSQVFIVPKPNQPGKTRFVCDMRSVNLESCDDSFQLPNVNHVLDQLSGCTIFSQMDLTGSFHQICYDEKSRPITAFTDQDGKRWWYKRLVQGHKASGSQFSRMMYKLLSVIPIGALIYFFDDLLIGSKDVKSHIEKLRIVLERFRQANLKLSASKCRFLQSEAKFVGLTISASGINMNEERVRALECIQSPKNKKELMSLLGFFGFNRKFIKNYALLTFPMYQLLRKTTAFVWSKKCQENLDSLKSAIKDSTTLCIPEVNDPHSSYVIETDASQNAIAATLSQEIGVNRERRVIAYFSKNTSRHKRQWGQTRLEFLAMYHAIIHWDIYLRGTKFKIITDCRSLLFEKNLFKNDAIMQRRIQRLAQYDFTLKYRAGEENVVPDFMSRYLCDHATAHKSCQTDTVIIKPKQKVDIDQLNCEMFRSITDPYGQKRSNMIS